MNQYYELYHHGIKGMKWGVRRFQKKDGSLTPAGLKRYSDTEEGVRLKQNIKDAKKELKTAKRNLNKTVGIKARYRAMDRLNKSTVDLKRAELDYSTGKELNRMKNKNVEIQNKSKHRLKLESKFKEIGMTDEQAEAAANKRIRTEKILAATAAMTVTAAAAYALNEQRKSKIDGVIKAGQKLQRVEMTDTKGQLHDVFYASTGDHDNKRYLGLLGHTRKKQTGEAFVMELAAKKDVKVASKDTAAKVFEDLYRNDPTFKKDLHYNSFKIHGQSVNLKGGLTNPTKKDMKKLYEAFNVNLVEENRRGGAILEGEGTPAKRFYDALKKQGYGAIQDINDQKYSGYNAKNPLIIFDNENANITVKKISELTGNTSNKNAIELGKATVEELVKPKNLAKIGLGFGIGAATKAIDNPVATYSYLPSLEEDYNQAIAERKEKQKVKKAK